MAFGLAVYAQFNVQHIARAQCYATLQKEGWKPSVLKMVTKMPLRFFHLYFLRLGFLDGVPGFQVCMYTAFYTFVKQAKFWEKYRAIPQPDPEAERLLPQKQTASQSVNAA